MGTRIAAGLALLTGVALCGTALAADATHHKLACPAQAPAAWGIGAHPLAGVEVLSAPHGEKIDETAPPSLVPDEQTRHGRTLQQVWTMNADGPGWDFYVDCHYAQTARILRLPAGGVARCERRLLTARADGPQSLTCD